MNYLSSVKEIENQIFKATTQLLERAKWTQKFKSALDFYTQYSIFKTFNKPDLCQVN